MSELNASNYDELSPEDQAIIAQQWSETIATLGTTSMWDEAVILDEPMGYDEQDRPIGYYNHEEPVGDEEASELRASKVAAEVTKAAAITTKEAVAAAKARAEAAAAEQSAEVVRIYKLVMDRKDQELADKDEQLAAQEKRIEWLKHDELTGELIRKGLHDELLHNPELVAEFAAPIEAILRGEDPIALGIPIFGVVFGDMGGVKAANSLGGMPLGDAFIGGGMKSFDNQLKTQSRQRERRADDTIDNGRRQGDRRTVDAKYPDILARVGGDEIAAIARNFMSEESLQAISSRLEPAFSVAAVKEKYDEQHRQEAETPGSVVFTAPYVAGIGSASILELSTDQLRSVGELNGDGLYKIFDMLCGIADQKQKAVKQKQYDEMWEAILETVTPEIREVSERPEGRKLIEIYWRSFFPDYVENPYKYIHSQDTPNTPEA